jgi:hypothetical protein
VRSASERAIEERSAVSISRDVPAERATGNGTTLGIGLELGLEDRALDLGDDQRRGVDRLDRAIAAGRRADDGAIVSIRQPALGGGGQELRIAGEDQRRGAVGGRRGQAGDEAARRRRHPDGWSADRRARRPGSGPSRGPRRPAAGLGHRQGLRIVRSASTSRSAPARRCAPARRSRRRTPAISSASSTEGQRGRAREPAPSSCGIDAEALTQAHQATTRAACRISRDPARATTPGGGALPGQELDQRGRASRRRARRHHRDLAGLHGQLGVDEHRLDAAVPGHAPWRSAIMGSLIDHRWYAGPPVGAKNPPSGPAAGDGLATIARCLGCSASLVGAGSPSPSAVAAPRPIAASTS